MCEYKTTDMQKKKKKKKKKLFIKKKKKKKKKTLCAFWACLPEILNLKG